MSFNTVLLIYDYLLLIVLLPLIVQSPFIAQEWAVLVLVSDFFAPFPFRPLTDSPPNSFACWLVRRLFKCAFKYGYVKFIVTVEELLASYDDQLFL